MKTAKLTLMFLACAAAIPALAQNTTDSRCGTTNYDSSRNMYTIVNPATGTATQQCFITVVPKSAWTGGSPNLASSQLVEGNYEVALSGAGGGGGGGGGGEREHGRNEAGTAGSNGNSAIPVTTLRYLNPGVYRITIGSGGPGGMAGPNGEHVARSGGRGADGAPTSLSNANTGETLAGFAGAESWNRSDPLIAVAYSEESKARHERHADADGGYGGKHAQSGFQGGNGFIKLALKDAAPQAAPAMSSSSETVATPALPAARPARKARN